MKLSKNTVTLLKNFSGISANLRITPGKAISTIASSGSILAEATIEDEFEKDFAIYDLNEFLGILSLFDDPEIEFDDLTATIKEGKRKVTCYGAALELIKAAPVLSNIAPTGITFPVPADVLSKILKAASVLKVPDFSIIGDGEEITIQVGNKKNPTGNSYTNVVGTTDKNFRADIKIENLRMLPGDYECWVANKKMAIFDSQQAQLRYFVAFDPHSKWDF